ncbi:cytochrome P450 76T24-like [Macadamia integrifolia]|uniref:cytochrome P450 76T24-like n=1 Tax=Macadamia integrifolia TaxID=60698 RepID=UPI001C52B197|nr:cytochrome P450 76T24-like [Macadamia integrifolia]
MTSNLVSRITGMVCEGWSWTVIALSIASILFVWHEWVSKKWKKQETPMPPGPRGLPFIGNLLSLEADLHLCFTKLAKTYGPILKLQLGSKLCVVVSSPLLVKEVLKDQDAVFANRSPPIAGKTVTYGGIDIIWSPNGPGWRTMRKVFGQKLMNNKSLDACYGLRQQEVHQMIREVYSKIGTPINIGEKMFLTMLNLFMSMLWGGTLQGEEKTSLGVEIREVVAEMVDLSLKTNISDIFPVLAWLDIQGIERRGKKLLAWMDRIIDSVINQRLKMDGEKRKGKMEEEEKKDFLQFLLELQKEGDVTTSLTMIQLKALLLDIIGGGTDTTSSTVEWVMAELMQHPEIMRKTQKEIEEVVGMDNLVEESHLSRFSYLNAIVKETLRLHPVIPFLVPHCPNVSSTVGGYTIPSGTSVFINVWKLHRDPEAWEKPSEFLPERFLNNTEKYDYRGNNFTYIPFGSGRRICAGIPLADKMSMYVLASLLHSFEWKVPNGMELDLAEKFGIVLKKKNPLVIIPVPRLSNVKLYM